MGRTMSDEQRATLDRARAVQRQIASERKARSIAVADWRLWQLDDWNWALQKGTDEASRRYYPDMPTALTVLLHQRIGERSSGDLHGVIKAIEGATRELLNALK